MGVAHVGKFLHPIIEWIKKHLTLLKVIFFALILFFVAKQVTQIAHGMSWDEILQTIKAQNHRSLFGMVCVGLAGVMPMLLYDYVVIRTLEKEGRPHLNRKDWFVSAWTTNTINNLAGFGGVVGVSLRSNFYGRGIEKRKVLATVSKTAMFMLVGLSLLAGFAGVDVAFFHRNSQFVGYRLWLLLGGLFAFVVLFFVYLRRKTLFKEFSWKDILLLYLASLGQWSGALLVFLAVGKLMGLDFAANEVYVLFVTATGLGMLTMVPGGAGTFDVMMILALSRLGLDQNLAVVWILFYRIFYYLIPFVTGLVIFLTSSSIKFNRFFDNLPLLFSRKVAHTILVVAVYFAGIMMVLLSTVTNLSNLNRFFNFILPFSFDFLDQTLNLLIGFLLLGLARGISQKVKKAFWPTILLLAFGIINTVLRTASIRLIVVYVLILLAVWVSRKEFYREKFVYSWGSILGDALLFGFLFIFYGIAGYRGGIKDKMGTQIDFPSETTWFSGMIGLALSLVGLAMLYQYLAQSEERLGVSWDADRFQKIVNKYGGTVTSHYLKLPGYDYYYYQENGVDQVVFGYQVKANKCFVLGDPVGDRQKWKAGTVAFMTHADQLGYQLAFYKATQDYVLLLHDLGFYFDKIGETGITLLNEQSAKNFEYPEIKALLTEGYRFEYYAKASDDLVKELAIVSNNWLDGEKEKQFSIGRFDKTYIQSSAVGVAYDPDDLPIGFITEQPITKKIASYDLLRFRSDAPTEIGNFLILGLCQELKRQGFKKVNMGMAPLANVGDTSYAFFSERIMNLIYTYGTSYYAFKQITEEKSLYVDAWDPRYFAYMKRSSFLFSTLQLLSLAGRGKHKGSTLTDEIMIEV